MVLMLILLLHTLIMPVCVCVCVTPCGSPVVYNYTLSFKCFWTQSAYLTHFCLPCFSHPPVLFLLSHLSHYPSYVSSLLINPPPTSAPTHHHHHHQGCCSVLRSRLPTLLWGITGGDILPPHSVPSYSGCSQCGTRMLVRTHTHMRTHTHCCTTLLK